MNLVNGVKITALCALIFVSVTSYSTANTWMNTSGGLWSEPTNWSTGLVPDSNEIVYINGVVDFNVVLDRDIHVKGLVMNGMDGTQTLISNGWHIRVNGNITVGEHAAMDLTACNVYTSGTYLLDNTGAITVDLGSIEHKITNKGTIQLTRTCSFTQPFVNDTSGTMTLEGTSGGGTCYLTVDTGFVNRGTIDLTSSWPVSTTTAELTVSNGYLVNDTIGIINAQLGASFSNASIRELNGTLRNHGTIRADAGLRIDAPTTTHQNFGTVVAQAGNVGFTADCTFENYGTLQTYDTVAISFSDAVFDNHGTFANSGTIQFSSSSASLNVVTTNNGRITLVGTNSTLILGDSLVNQGTLYAGGIGATVDGLAPLINEDSIVSANLTIETDVYNDGVIRSSGWVIINGQLTTTVNSRIVSDPTSATTAYVVSDGGFVNNGVIELTQSYSANSWVTVSNVADTLLNASTGVIRSVAGTGGSAYQRYIQARVVNQGTIEVNGADLTVEKSNATHTNEASISVVDGYLYIKDGFTHSGTATIEDAGRLYVDSCQVVFNRCEIHGAGKFQLRNDTTTINDTTFVFGYLWFNGGLGINNSLIDNTGQVDLYPSTLNGSGMLYNRGYLKMWSSTLGCVLYNAGLTETILTCNFNASVVNDADDTLRVLATSDYSSSATCAIGMTNNGVLQLTSTATDTTRTSTFSVTSGSLTNGATGVVVASRGNSNGGSRTLNAQLNNSGLVTTDGITLVFDKSSADHINAYTGLVEVNNKIELDLIGGSPTFTNNGTIRFANLQTLTVDGGDFINSSTGRLSGSGSLNVYATTFTNDGFVQPGDSLAGKINMQANTFPMSSSAQIDIGIGGYTPITEYDQVYCTQNASLDGVLNLALINDFAPTVGDSFKVMTYTTRIGNFLGILGLNQMGYVFDTNFVSDGLWIHTASLTNSAPTITGMMPDSVTFRVDSSILLGIWNYVADDMTSDTNLVYAFGVTNDSINYTELNAAGFMTLSATEGYSGSGWLIMNVTDYHGAWVTDSIHVTVTPIPNTPPVISGLPAIVTFRADSTETIDIWAAVSDAEDADDEMSYFFSTTNDSVVATYSELTGVLTLSADTNFAGSADLTVTVTDSQSDSDVDTVTVVVSAYYPNYPPTLTGLPDTVSFDRDSTATLMMFNYSDDPETSDLDLDFGFTPGTPVFSYQWYDATGRLDLFTEIDHIGISELFIVVTDEAGASVTDTIVVNIYESNTAPVLSFPDTLMFDSDTSRVISLWDYAVDAESHDSLLQYAVSSDNDSLLRSFDSLTGVLTLTAETGFAGIVEMVISVTDPDTSVVHDTVLVTVLPSLSVGDEAVLPDRYALGQNYPNPFNPTTTIELALPRASRVAIYVYNITGQRIRTLLNRQLPAGRHLVNWDGTDDGGSAVASGVYFYRMVSDSFTGVRKMLLIK